MQTNTIKKIFKTVMGERGFTIFETVLTTAVLAAGLMGSVTVMQNAVAHTANSDMTTIATQKANEKIEEVMADNQYHGFDYVTGSNYATETIAEYSMERSVVITEVNADDLSTAEVGSGHKKIDVTVCWGDSTNTSSNQQVTVSTLVVDY